MNLVDAADAQVDRINTPHQSQEVHTWKIMVEREGRWEKLDKFTGSGSKAAAKIQEALGTKRGRWARGYGSKCIASDGEAEKVWITTFGES